MTQKRTQVRELFDKVKMAIDDVQYLQEKVKRKDVDGDTVRGVSGCVCVLCVCMCVCVRRGRCCVRSAPAFS